jgi:hypothetical protein
VRQNLGGVVRSTHPRHGTGGASLHCAPWLEWSLLRGGGSKHAEHGRAMASNASLQTDIYAARCLVSNDSARATVLGRLVWAGTLASMVFPVPGGPYSSTPLVWRHSVVLYRSGCSMGVNTLSSCTRSTCCQCAAHVWGAAAAVAVSCGARGQYPLSLCCRCVGAAPLAAPCHVNAFEPAWIASNAWCRRFALRCVRSACAAREGPWCGCSEGARALVVDEGGPGASMLGEVTQYI